MQPVKSTIEVLAFKVLNRNVTDAWVDWAIDMLTVGFDTEHLVMLAGETEPFNQFHMQALTNKVFNELHLDYSDKDNIIKKYVCYLVDKTLTGESATLRILRTLMNLCVELDYEKSLYHFYTLYYAKEDLFESENQWYLEGADRSNIDNIIFEYLTHWKANC